MMGNVDVSKAYNVNKLVSISSAFHVNEEKQ